MDHWWNAVGMLVWISEMVINDKDIIRGDLDKGITMNGVLKQHKMYSQLSQV